MEDLLSGIGIFICVGAVILVILAVVGVRAIFAGRDREQARTIEQPRFDNSDVDTPGKFGGVPTTGGARMYDSDRDGVPDDAEQRQRRVDDDDVRTPGGFSS